MGLGTKIKDALSGDKEHHHSTTDTSKTPGSYPSEEVPRSHARNETANSNVLSSTSEPRAGNSPVRKSAEYTYGSKAGTTGTTGTTGRHSHEVAGQHDTGLARKGAAGTTGTSTGNKLSKGNTDPYWGSSERSAVNEPGLETGAYGHTGNDLHAQDVNDRYNRTSPRDDLTHTGTAGRGSGHNDPLTSGSTGSTGVYGSQNTPEGVHGPHSSRVANAADPRVDSDRDHRGAVGSSTLGSGTHGTHGGVGRDYDHHNTPGSAQTSTTTTTGTTSNLTHRPFDSSNNAREYKINEYDAPTSSSDRGHGTLAGAGAGVAAGYGASKLADRHHEHDLRDKDPSYSSGQYGDRHGNNQFTSGSTGSAGAYGSRNTAEGVHGPHSSRVANAADPRVDSDRDHRGAPVSRDFGSGAGTSMLDPHSSNTATKPGTGAGTSMLDPYGTSSGNTAGNHLGAETGTGLGSGSHVRDTYPDRQGYNTSSAVGTGSNVPGTYDQRHTTSTGSHLPVHGQGQNLSHGTGSGLNNDTESYGLGYGTGLADTLGKPSTTHNSGYGPGETRGSSEYSHETGPSGSEHFGPGHQAAKVMHKCHNCGADNDISRHFRNDAVYRMG